MRSPEMARSTGSYQARALAADARVHWLSIALRKSTAQEFAAPVATFGTLDTFYFWRFRCWFALGRIALSELAAPLAAVRAVRLLLRWAEGGKGAVSQSAALGAAAGAAAAPTNLTMPGEWHNNYYVLQSSYANLNDYK